MAGEEPIQLKQATGFDKERPIVVAATALIT